jgi:uncharacterized membrane protein
MPSLGDAYDRNSRGGRDPRRVLAGAALLVAGGLALVAAIVLVATAAAGGGTAAKHSAGVLAGLGIPAMLLGVVVVLPASRRNRLGVVGGAALTVAGVALFWHAYPQQWTRAGGGLTFETTMVYFVGAAIGLWFVFSAIATVRRRNDPQGTVRMEVVRQGSTRTIEVSRDRYRRIVSDGGDPSQLIRELDD